MGEKGVNNLIDIVDIDIRNYKNKIDEFKNDSFKDKYKYSECSNLIIKIIEKEIETLKLLIGTYKSNSKTNLFDENILLENYGYLEKVKEALIKIIDASKLSISAVSKDNTSVAKSQVFIERRYNDLFSKYKEKNE